MRANILAVIFLGTFFIIGCKSTESTPKEESKTAVKKEVNVNPNCVPIILEKELYDKVQNWGVQVLESKIEGNYLYLKYSFSGCPNDEIVLVWNNMLLKSYPGKAMLKLGYEETGSCDEMQIQDACYDLKDFININLPNFDLFSSIHSNNSSGAIHSLLDPLL
jgi:hypothetical protein